LQVPEQNPSVFHGKSSIIIPPLLLTAILDAASMDPTQLIPILSAKFQEFNHTSPTMKACTILRPVLEYLWAVHLKIVHPLVSSIERYQDSQDWCSNMHFAHIMPSIADNLPSFFSPLSSLSFECSTSQPALDAMAGNLRILRDASEHLQLREASSEENKKDSSGGWDKIPEVIQRMIVKLSAITDDVDPPPDHENLTFMY
jgi:hypothetical protein